MLFVIIWFFVDAHKWFKGPKINIEASQTVTLKLKRAIGGKTNRANSTECSIPTSMALRCVRKTPMWKTAQLAKLVLCDIEKDARSRL
jgi:hypothetical protein